MIGLSCFSDDYVGSRKAFLDRVSSCGGGLKSYCNTSVRGPHGDLLYTDVAVLGPPRSSRSLLLISGVHGTEGLVGAAVLSDLMASGVLKRMPRDMNAVLVHALNPWGMAHGTRTTESNVDLNRNFVDFSVPLPPNPTYSELHAEICSHDIETVRDRLRDSLLGPTAVTRGSTKRIDAIMRGQYEHADGINFGGFREEWSNRTFRALVTTHLREANQVACIDWHTGIGQPAEAVPLAFYPPGSPEASALSRWHDQDVTLVASHFPGGAAPRFTGILNTALPHMLTASKTYAVVVEFGTRPNSDVLDALVVDRWLKFCANSSLPLARRLREEMLDCFSPRDDKWRAAVLELGRWIVTRTIDGLATV